MDIQFPLYKKYTNDMSYFRVDSETEFVELKKQPKGWIRIEFEAKILPDRNYIQDMIHNQGGHWVDSNVSEFEALESQVKNQ